jgi:hypothetical protein
MTFILIDFCLMSLWSIASRLISYLSLSFPLFLTHSHPSIHLSNYPFLIKNLSIVVHRMYFVIIIFFVMSYWKKSIIMWLSIYILYISISFFDYFVFSRSNNIEQQMSKRRNYNNLIRNEKEPERFNGCLQCCH